MLLQNTEGVQTSLTSNKSQAKRAQRKYSDSEYSSESKPKHKQINLSSLTILYQSLKDHTTPKTNPNRTENNYNQSTLTSPNLTLATWK